MMFGRLFKKRAPRWSDLSSEQRHLVASKIARGVKAFAPGARYKLVDSTDAF